ncbi:ribonuclease H-like domain-containing protein [Tanacetum coccineum]
MDTGASSHLNSHTSNLNTVYNKCLYPSVCVSDGKSISVTNIGHNILPTLDHPLYLHNILVTPYINENLIFVCQFTRDNNYTIEFDAFGFLVKDFLTHHILLRCDSSGDLYLVTLPSPTPHDLLFVSPKKSSHLCHACQLGKHVRLLFASSESIVTRSFEIVNSDIWTSPIISSGGFKYYFGVDCDDTFSLVVKPDTIRTVLSLVLSQNWHIYQLDEKNAFFNGNLSEIVYMYQPLGYAYRVGFSSSRYDSSLFIYQHGSEVTYLLIYVDDIVLTASSTDLLQRIISSLHKEFDMTELGALNYFLRIFVTRNSTCMFLS